MEAEFLIEALEAAKNISVWASCYEMLRKQEEEYIRLGNDIPDHIIELLFESEKSVRIKQLTNLLIRVTDTDCKVAGWSALIASSREAVNKLCSTFEKYPQCCENEKDLEDLLRTVQELEERKATISRKSTTTTQPKHFNSPQSKEKLTTIFQRLKKGCYFDDSADLETWLYICGVGDLNGDFKPLNWIESAALLGYLIKEMKLTANRNQIWITTAVCFTVKGLAPNNENLIVSFSRGVKNDNPKRLEIDMIIG